MMSILCNSSPEKDKYDKMTSNKTIYWDKHYNLFQFSLHRQRHATSRAAQIKRRQFLFVLKEKGPTIWKLWFVFAKLSFHVEINKNVVFVEVCRAAQHQRRHLIESLETVSRIFNFIRKRVVLFWWCPVVDVIKLFRRKSRKSRSPLKLKQQEKAIS